MLGYGRIDVAKALGESQNLFNTKDERNMTGRAEPKEMLRSMVEGATVIIPSPPLALIHQN